jgi:beta-glucosidase
MTPRLSGLLLCLSLASISCQSAKSAIVCVEAPAAAPTQTTVVVREPADDRADALIAQMTLAEELSMLWGAGGSDEHTDTSTAIPRLNIPSVDFTDGPAGIRSNAATTALPAPAALAATWDTNLAALYGDVLARDALGHGDRILFGPMVNIVRIPQGGRDFETLGEDPYLTSQIAVAEVQAIQARGVIATVKHFAANNQEHDRETVDAVVDDRTLHEIYLPAFAATVEDAQAGALMAAFNKVNGTYCSENAPLLTKILRDQWGFSGILLSDWNATHSAIGAATAGLDLEMPVGWWYPNLGPAVQSGAISQAIIDEHAHHVLRTLIKFGFFDSQIPPTQIDITADGGIAKMIAEQGTVLLKNVPLKGQALLPLDAGRLHHVAVIGAAAMTAITGGNGSSHVIPSYAVSPLQGITERLGNSGTVVGTDGTDIPSAVKIARDADVALVFVNDTEGEGGDRGSLALDGNQDDLVAAVAAAQPRTVVVLNVGAPVLMPWIHSVPAIVQSWYGGEEGGHAVASVLFGDINPSGRLPVTFPADETHLPASTPAQYPGVNDEATYSEGVFVGYRYYDANKIAPLFPFGHGLSYTQFDYGDLSVSSVGVGGVRVALRVRNTGMRAGTEVVQLYLEMPSTDVSEPPRQLKGFRKVDLAPGESQPIVFLLDTRAMSHWDTKAQAWSASVGTYGIDVGASSRDIRLSSKFEYQPICRTPPAR